MPSPDDYGLLYGIFMPRAVEQHAAISKRYGRFVHYTQAGSGIRIIEGRSVWMRNIVCMNDYMEGQLGLRRLLSTRRSELGEKFVGSVNSLHANLFDEVENLFNPHIGNMLQKTFIACVSEHDDATENLLGRLSMWRAYGGTSAVALVLNPHPFLTPSDALNAYTYPVSYLDDAGFHNLLSSVTENIVQHTDMLRRWRREDLKNTLFLMLQYLVICTKHLGFSEELEWRVVYNPTLRHSDKLLPSIEILNGVPQEVYKIPLENIYEQGLTGMTIPDLIQRVIIGPTQFPLPIYHAYVRALHAAGVDNAAERVVISDIPLRT